MKFIFIFSVLSILLSSCSTYSEEQINGFDATIKKKIKKDYPQLKFEKSVSGLYYHILEEGEGREVLYTDIVSFTYTGKLMNGKVFDKQTNPLTFDIRKLIAAWREIMLEMKKGGKAILFAPPQLAYGDHQLDDIPKNSILFYEIELIDVK